MYNFGDVQNVYLSKMQNIATVVDDCAIIYGAQSKLEILIRFTEIKIPILFRSLAPNLKYKPLKMTE